MSFIKRIWDNTFSGSQAEHDDRSPNTQQRREADRAMAVSRNPTHSMSGIADAFTTQGVHAELTWEMTGMISQLLIKEEDNITDDMKSVLLSEALIKGNTDERIMAAVHKLTPFATVIMAQDDSDRRVRYLAQLRIQAEPEQVSTQDD